MKCFKLHSWPDPGVGIPDNHFVKGVVLLEELLLLRMEDFYLFFAKEQFFFGVIDGSRRMLPMHLYGRA